MQTYKYIYIYLSIFKTKHVPVVLEEELTALPELQKEHSCIVKKKDMLNKCIYFLLLNRGHGLKSLLPYRYM